MLWITLTTLSLVLPVLLILSPSSKLQILLRLKTQQLVFLYFYIPSFFGVFGIMFDKVSFYAGLEQTLSRSTIVSTFVDYIIAFILLIIIFFLLTNTFIRFDKKIIKLFTSETIKGDTFFAISHSIIIIIFCFELFRIPSIPLFEFINGGIVPGAISRGEVIEYQIENGIPLFGYIINYVPSILFCWVIVNKKLGRIRRFLFTIIFIGYYLLFLSKSFFVTPFLLIFILTRLITRSSNLIYIFIAFGIMFGMFFFVSSDVTSMMSILTSRLFVGQVEGLFLVREYYPNPRFDALINGFPLFGVFHVDTFDPHVAIISEVFGETVEGWVNMNAMFIGQGAVMMGKVIVVLGPLIVGLNIYLCYSTAMFFEKFTKNGICLISGLYFVVTLPFNQNFSLLLYFKPLIGLTVVCSFFCAIKVISRSSKHNN